MTDSCAAIVRTPKIRLIKACMLHAAQKGKLRVALRRRDGYGVPTLWHAACE
jgi:hypothetical protein